MEPLLAVVLQIASAILAAIAVLIMLYRFRSDSRRIRNYIAILSFLIVLFYGALGILVNLAFLGAAFIWAMTLFLTVWDPNSTTSE